MGSLDRLHLRWNDYEANVKSGFSELRKEEELFDITLAVGSQQIKAHKVILSACSPFFRSLIKSVPHQHPLLYLRGIQPRHLESLLCFIYNGEVNITADDLGSLLSVAEDLQIKGLTRHLKAQESGPSSSSSSSPAKRTRLDAESRIPANKHLLEDEDSLDEDERKGNHDKMEALDDPGSEDEDSLDNYSSTNDPISLVSSEYYGMYDESGLMDPESGDGSSFRAPNFSDNYIKSKEKA
ncbi:Broad-complex core protein isoform 6, partial [Caligus rogercresseyi]